ncbi:cytochrome P450 71D10-like [Neltuma alba]|uniref:cytochrome P450 71D10-like n=1 Tax=Neltuma alba TaxID=207710 RepID=UPI0010A341A8|nr:cytochrome P450 71D10-like [Prosopis alba]XP_028803167.1 cytochrome P450 71D10-like [Prosopis alba]
MIMEFHSPSAILFTFLCFILLIHKLSNSRKCRNLPPGPPKLPIIGNLHQLLVSIPTRSLRDLSKKYGPLMYLQLGQLPFMIVSSPEIAKEVMKTHDQIFANRPKTLATDIFAYNGSDIVFSPYGNYWRQLRKICTLELLSAKRVQTFKNIREEEVSMLMKDIREYAGSVMNLSKKIFPLTNSIVARAAFGKKTKNVEAILPTIEHTIQLISGLNVIDFYPSLGFLSVITGIKATMIRLQAETDRIFQNIITDHEEKNLGNHAGEDEDLVDVLLRIQKENDLEIPLSYDNIKGVIKDIFVGGTETAATTIEWTMTELLRNPVAMKRAQEEVRRVFKSKGCVDESEISQLKYVAAVIKEVLRLHPAVPLLVPRENRERCKINGYEIPAKTRIIVNAWAIGRDPKYWDEPEKFIPERFLDTTVNYSFTGSNFEFIPFGAGRRICPGIAFATPVVELIISNMLYHFDWQLPNGMKAAELDVEESFGATMRRKNDLCVIPFKYSP